MTMPELAGVSRQDHIAALRRTALRDTSAEVAFDRLTMMATRALNVPVSLAFLVNHDREFFKICARLPEPWVSDPETPLPHPFCRHVVERKSSLLVSDVREHPLYHRHLAVRDLDVVAYAGVPLVTTQGDVLGSVCVIDSEPRQWTAAEIMILTGLAASVVTEIELRTSVAEHRRTNGAVESSEQLLRGLVAYSGDWIWEMDSQAHFTYVSPSASHILGRPAEQLLSRTFFDFMAAEEASRFADVFWIYLSACLPFADLETSLLHADGNPVILETSGSPVFDERGALRAFRGVARDITQRRRSETALRLSEDRYRLLADGVSDLAIIMLAPDGSVTSWSGGAAAITGYQAPEAIGKTIGFLDPAGQFPTRELDAAAEKGRQEYTTLRVRRDGSVFPAHVVLTATRGPNGQLLGYSKVLQDVSEKMATEDELRTLSLVASKTDNAVIITDADGRIEWVNEGFTRITGYTRSESIGQKPGMLLQGPQTDYATIDRIQQHLRRGESFVEEILNYHRDGTPYWISMAVTPIHDDGRIVRFIAIETDITERKAASAELARAKEEAEYANAAKSEFLARMSHELRTPLNAVLGFGQLLLADADSDDNRESAEHIVRAGRHLLSLINEVLDIARIETGEVPLAVAPVCVSDAVQQSLDLIRPLAEERLISLTVEREPSREVWVMADLQRLKQILLNLLSNAVKYNRPMGTVTVACRGAGAGRLRILVTDSGIGIAPEKASRLFTPFDRLGAEHEGIEGTGLGLALSKRIAEAMGGTIGMESNPGGGSTFWIELAEAELPRTLAGRDRGPRVSLFDAAPVPSAPERTVLYIEDSLPNYRLVERIFDRMQGIRLIPAMQGRLGVELAQRHLPDLILLDLNLPDIPGDEVLRLLRQHPMLQDTPVVVISANAKMDQIQHLENSGVCAYLTKPFDLAAFTEVTERLLKQAKNVPC